ncbi:MAG: glycosyltransferase family 2 protein [Oceanospirillaceae bacterium]|nr:glycosyltransferase family 2 protein [Oceanospirillaceae bacterium]
MENILLGLLFTSWLLIIYHHLLYPTLLLKLAGSTRFNRANKISKYVTQIQLPSISILVPAYNEAKFIAAKIHNLAALDYPAHKLEVVVVCDGCTDDSYIIASRAARDSQVAMLDITVINQPKNSGKIAILNRYIPQLKGEIIALSDTSALISIDALQISARYFLQPEVSVVAGCYLLEQSASAGEEQYWQWQTKIKQAEALLGSPIGVHGALYFFTAKDFTALPQDTINDDFILPMTIIAKGKKAIYSTQIIALELECADLALERNRRVRIGAGNLQQLLRCAFLLQPKYRFTAFNFASGKALRALMPALLLLQILLCLALSTSYLTLLILALLQLAAVFFAWLLTDNSHVPKIVKMLCYVLNGYRCALLGSFLYCSQQFNKNWH